MLSLYARGLKQREIRAYLEDMCQVSVPADLTSRVTDAVREEAKDWQGRPLGLIARCCSSMRCGCASATRAR